MLQQINQLLDGIGIIIGTALVLYIVAYVISAAVFKARSRFPHTIEQTGNTKNWIIHVEPNTPPPVINQMLDSIESIIKARENRGRK
jgi:hypothetical protein